jgi:hypothetical protein
MRSSAEFSIDLTAEELLTATTGSQQTLAPQAPTSSPIGQAPLASGESVEIELTAEEIDALLSCEFQF